MGLKGGLDGEWTCSMGCNDAGRVMLTSIFNR